jgi:hypothetical protein
VESESSIKNLEEKVRRVGNQIRWWGTIVFLVGIIMAIFEASGGVVITALGIIVALQGAIIQYVFK